MPAYDFKPTYVTQGGCRAVNYRPGHLAAPPHFAIARGLTRPPLKRATKVTGIVVS